MTATLIEIEPLTGREEDVLRLMTAGQTNAQIANQLVVSIETVRWYTKQIYGKLGVHSRTQAVLRSRELGLFQEGRKKTAEPKPPPQPTPEIKLPKYTTPFIGREQYIQEISDLLARADVRLVTIAGPGGTGKTRFCVELARQNSGRYPHGVYFISLASLDSIKEAVTEIGRQLGIQFSKKVQPDRQLAAFLEGKQLLLILDNLEHLADAATWVDSLLDSTDDMQLLVSSQSSLNISAEWVRYLGGVPCPDPANSHPENYPAVKLFAERAYRVRSSFELEANLDCIAEICRHLHGLPLALELAAAWIKSLDCTEIAAELKGGSEFLITRHTDLEERHQSLQAVFNYAWKLLSNQEKRVLLRLSPFRGGFSRKTAEEVGGADLTMLTNLVDKSFLVQSPQGNFMFHDLLRQYALNLLEQMNTDNLTTRSSKLLLWSLFIKGDFKRAEQLAADILSRSTPASVEQAFGLALTGLLAGMGENYEHCLEMNKVAQSLLERAANFQDTMTQLFVHLGLAVGACGFRQYDQVQIQTGQAIQRANEMQSPAFVLLCLPLTAVLLAHNAESEQAVQLLSLTFNHPAHTSDWLEKWPLLTQLQSDMTAELGLSLYNELWQQGKSLNLEATTTGLLSVLQETD